MRDDYETKYKIIIVNNSLEDREIIQLQSDTVKIIDSGKNIGFARACNLGLQQIYEQDSTGIIWLINPDAYLVPDSLQSVMPFLTKYPQISILGTIIHTPSGKKWFAGGRFFPDSGTILEVDLLTTNPNVDYVHCDWVSGCSLLINCQKFAECPQFDPHYFLYYDDVDFCQKYRNQGHVVAITEQLKVIHQPSSITNRNVYAKIKHSTYSYLFTLAKYTSTPIWLLRFLRLFSYGVLLLLIKPQVAMGKIAGIISYFQDLFGDDKLDLE